MEVTATQIAIIGGGPAGVAAAIQLKRFGYEVILLEKDRIGGLLNNANIVENYIGFPFGISGLELCRKMSEHLERLNIKPIFQEALQIDYDEKFYYISTNSQLVRSEIVVIASGTEPLTLESPEIPQEALGNVFYEIKDLRSIAGKKIGVIGAGDAAFDYSLSLSQNNKVEILNRGHKIKAIAPLVEQCLDSNNINYIENIKVKEIFRKNDEILVNCITEKGLIENYYDYLLIAIGRKHFKPIVSEKVFDTKCFFLIGDVCSQNSIRQASIAAGSGIELAMKIHYKLGSKDENYC